MIQQVNIVLIDDDPIQGLLWKAKLGDRVFYVPSVKENMDVLKRRLSQQSISLVFLDCELLDGSDVYQNIEILRNLRFSYLFLSTSHPAEYFENLPMVSMVLNKEVPAWLTDFKDEDLFKISKPIEYEEKYTLRKLYLADEAKFRKFQKDLANFLKEAHQEKHLGSKSGFSRCFYATWERCVYEQVHALELEKRLLAIRFLMNEEFARSRYVG